MALKVKAPRRVTPAYYGSAPAVPDTQDRIRERYMRKRRKRQGRAEQKAMRRATMDRLPDSRIYGDQPRDRKWPV